MFATIELSPYIHVQGRLTRILPDGKGVIDVLGRRYVGALTEPVAFCAESATGK